MLRLLNILPFLAFDAAGSTMDMIFAKIKAQAMGGASTSAALTLATFIVGVKMIRMAYNIFSDEQQGGFGGIRLIEVLRPILIVLAINVSGTMFGAMDSVVNYITGSVGKSFGVASMASAYNKAAEDAIEKWQLSQELRDEIKDLGENKEKIAEDAGKKYVEGYKQAAEKYSEAYRNSPGAKKDYKEWENQGKKAGLNEVKEKVEELSQKGKTEVLSTVPEYVESMAAINKWEAEQLSAIAAQKESLKGWQLFQKADLAVREKAVLREAKTRKKKAEDLAIKEIGGEEVLNQLVKDINSAVDYTSQAGQNAASNPSLAGTEDLETTMKGFFKKLTTGVYFRMFINWIYDALYFCVKTFADIGLIMLALIFPWILCLSLLDFFKQAIWQFFATYLSLSMYKVVASGINWIICSASVSLSVINVKAILPTFSSDASAITAIATELSVKAVLYAAGAIAMTKTGSLVSMMIPGGASTGDFGGGGAAIATGAMSKGAAAAKSVMGTAKGFATGQSGIQQAIKSKKSGKATQEFQQNVTNALGKLTGNSGSNSSSGS